MLLGVPWFDPILRFSQGKGHRVKELDLNSGPVPLTTAKREQEALWPGVRPWTRALGGGADSRPLLLPAPPLTRGRGRARAASVCAAHAGPESSQAQMRRLVSFISTAAAPAQAWVQAAGIGGNATPVRRPHTDNAGSVAQNSSGFFPPKTLSGNSSQTNRLVWCDHRTNGPQSGRGRAQTATRTLGPHSVRARS